MQDSPEVFGHMRIVHHVCDLLQGTQSLEFLEVDRATVSKGEGHKGDGPCVCTISSPRLQPSASAFGHRDCCVCFLGSDWISVTKYSSSETKIMIRSKDNTDGNEKHAYVVCRWMQRNQVAITKI
jgi:hypothetical protein